MVLTKFRGTNALLTLAALVLPLSAGETGNPLASDAGLRLAVEQTIYRLDASGDGTYRGSNPAQHLAVEFGGHGTRLEHAQGTSRFRLSGYGYGEVLRTPIEAKPVGADNRVEYRRGELTEWYKNEWSGVEQGFTLERRPGAARAGESLVIALAVDGELAPKLASTGDAVLLESKGQTVLRYGGLHAWDARGRSLSARMEVREREVRLAIEDEAAEYPLVVDPTFWTQQAELTDTSLIPVDFDEMLGTSVAVSGDTAVAGGDGVVFIWLRTGTTWNLQQVLSGMGGFGHSVSVDGDTLVIGASDADVLTNTQQGAAFVYLRTAGVWSQQAELTASDGTSNDNFGFAVSLSGDTIVVGAPNHQVGTNAGQGTAYVFVRSGATWSQQGPDLNASDGAAGDQFGSSVSLNGDTIVVGAPNHQVGTNAGQGTAYVFVRSGTTWSQQAELTAPDGMAMDGFGWSAAVSGDTAVIGSRFHLIGVVFGAAYVFVRSGTSWSQQGPDLAPSDATQSMVGFADAVAVNGDTILIGAQYQGFPPIGAVYVFARSGTTWSQQTELSTSSTRVLSFGYSVALTANTALIGAPYTQTSVACSVCIAGAAFVFVPPPSLTISKTDNVGGSTIFPNGWTWTITVANSGPGSATFNSGDTILTDDLPGGATYGTITVTPGTGISGTGTISCVIASAALSCTASGGTVIIGTGTGASFTVAFPVTPLSSGLFVNPDPSRSPSICAVDPNGVTGDSDTTNNGCEDSVNVTALPDLTISKSNDVGGSTTFPTGWNWKLTVTNSGNGAAAFTAGSSVLTDTLPTGVTYGTPVIVNPAGGISCSITSNTLGCFTTAATSIAASGGFFTVTFSATPGSATTFTNPGGTTPQCMVDPSNLVTESNETNNNCNPDTVVVHSAATGLTVVKTDNVSGSTTFPNGWTWNLAVTNPGATPVTFSGGATILHDNLPTTNLSYGAVTTMTGSAVTGTIGCSIDGTETLTCTAGGAGVSIGTGAGGTFSVSFSATPSMPGIFANPAAGGSCVVSPSNNTCSDTVTVQPAQPDLTAHKTNDVGGTTTLGTSWTWSVRVINSGSASATFNTNDVILLDTLPPTNITYGTPTPGLSSGISGTGTVSCAILPGTMLTCIASGGTVVIASPGYFTVGVLSTPTSTGTFINPGGTTPVCMVDPNNVIAESDETNNACNHDPVVVSPMVTLNTSGLAAGAGAPFQLHYAAHLDVGDSVINITNDGSSALGTGGSALLGNGNGDLCIGVYTFDMNEELQSCCTCLVTPNGLVSLSVDALNATNLTGALQTSLVIKLLAWSTTAGASTTAPPGTPAPPVSSSCNAASPGMIASGGSANLATGMHAWGTTIHALPVGQRDTYTATETPFSAANLSSAEFNHITQFCDFNQINGSGKFGQCKGCASGGMGATTAE